PTEAEWDFAASRAPGDGPEDRRRFAWGDDPPTPQLANLDGRALGVVDVAAFPAGDTAFGCRQMIGNVWEWTESDFTPFPGFSDDPYRDYSRPWFYTHKTARGGSWATRDRLVWNGWRNFAMAGRQDLFYGFRTCAL
ncbi:MAG: SUMF1/EgtB/PvdO family nonheme iron enzyme, partial [Rhodospirillales bacterium]|nr:SUMF1/EgtB/PvdO family nonheme iron enzyme [Rhodospirillales bacterium]